VGWTNSYSIKRWYRLFSVYCRLMFTVFNFQLTEYSDSICSSLVALRDPNKMGRIDDKLHHILYAVCMFNSILLVWAATLVIWGVLDLFWFWYTYKILFGLVINAANEFFTLANSVNTNINTCGHMYKLFLHHSRIDARNNFFHWASCTRMEQSTSWTEAL